MREWPIRPGERVGMDWRLTRVGGSKRGQQVIFDADSWKSFAASRWTVPMGGAGCWTLNGDKPYAHRLMADHLTAEFCEPTTSRGRTWEKWHLRPGRDNDWFDCLVGCAVAVSVLGVQWSPAVASGSDEAPKPRVKRKSLAEAMKGKEVLKL